MIKVNFTDSTTERKALYVNYYGDYYVSVTRSACDFVHISSKSLSDSVDFC